MFMSSIIAAVFAASSSIWIAVQACTYKDPTLTEHLGVFDHVESPYQVVSIRYSSLLPDHVWGKCHSLPTWRWSDTWPMMITINPELKRQPKLVLLSVLYHEMGHCLLNLQHGDRSRIMNTYAWVPKSRAQLDRELIKLLKGGVQNDKRTTIQDSQTHTNHEGPTCFRQRRDADNGHNVYD